MTTPDPKIIQELNLAIGNANLTEREHGIITYRFGLDGNGSHTLRATATHFGLSTAERVRQIEAKVLRKIRRTSALPPAWPSSPVEDTHWNFPIHNYRIAT